MTPECKELARKISEYLDNELDPSLCEQMEEHLAACPECRHCMESLQRTIQLCREASRQDVPSQVREHLRAALREQMRGRDSQK
jgi:RNA polymerase sigma-70 factor (ECF subfamily)